MKVLKKVTITIFFIIIIAIALLFAYLWPVDPRLSGTFQSDTKVSIEYLRSTRDLTDLQLDTFNQMYGHLFYEFNGHRVTIHMKPHTISDYPKGSETKIDETIEEYHFVMRGLENDKVHLIMFPSTFWLIDEVKSVGLEFENNGFWIINNSASFGSIQREKFSKLKANQQINTTE